MPLKLTTYYKGNEVPDLPGNNVFHSKELFLVYEATSGYSPIMIVGYIDEQPVVKLLAATRTNPSPFFRRCEIYGPGEYLDETVNREEIFGELLEHLTNEVLSSSFFVEFRNLDTPLFGYKHFRDNQYFAINWLKVRNSLHSQTTPEERISVSRRRQIKKGLKNGAEVYATTDKEDILAFSKMLKKNYSSKLRKHFPSIDFFKNFNEITASKGMGKTFVVKYKDKIIGGSVCAYTGDNAYLWFSGGLRKSYVLQYPGILAVWKAIEDAYSNGYRHLEFMDAGLPFRKHGYRDFILRFGGKQSSTRRWYRFNWKWLNNLLIKIYS